MNRMKLDRSFWLKNMWLIAVAVYLAAIGLVQLSGADQRYREGAATIALAFLAVTLTLRLMDNPLVDDQGWVNIGLFVPAIMGYAGVNLINSIIGMLGLSVSEDVRNLLYAVPVLFAIGWFFYTLTRYLRWRRQPAAPSIRKKQTP